MVYGDTLPEAYHLALRYLYAYGEEVQCPDYSTAQTELSMTMVVRDPLREPMISALFIGGPADLEKYTQEMLDGIMDFEVDAGKWAYTYHRRMIMAGALWQDQIQFVIDELKRNPDSRRAVIDVRDADQDMYSDDPACLQSLQFLIRNGKLALKVLFRSNDACKATFMNAFALIMLQKKVADELGIEVGQYVHRANSFHCYQKDFPMLKGYHTRIMLSSKEDIMFNYAGDWDEMMAEARPKIETMVNELKEKEYAQLTLSNW